MAETNQAKVKNITKSEIGVTGLQQFSGFIDEEILSELTGDRAIDVYIEMSKNDAIIGAILFAIKALLRQVKWSVKRASDNDNDVEAADFLTQNMASMTHTWESFVIEALSMLTFGWSYHEIVYRKDADSGRVMWKRLPIRSQDSRVNWVYSEDQRELLGMIQRVVVGPVGDLSIPLEKALLFRASQHKDNPEGESILRTAYRSWIFRKLIQNLEGIGVERDLAGIPIARMPARIFNSTDPLDMAIKLAMETMVKNIKLNEEAGLVIPSDRDETGNLIYDISLLGAPGGKQFDTGSIISRYSKEMVMTVLADFIMLGHESVGSFALADSKTSLFVVAIGGWLDIVKQELNRKAVPDLFGLNTFNIDTLPVLETGDIEKPDLDIMGRFLTALTAAGVILDENQFAHLKNLIGLPITQAEE